MIICCDEYRATVLSNINPIEIFWSNIKIDLYENGKNIQVKNIPRM